ncbi:MAG: hypothetical protein QOC86_86 [Gaiellales bacterium]|nr:hypothetical protein [Nocardioidaceae bacterium]MDX6570930.1 hypothetical protein [Gaiellales bacterium]
MIDYGEHPSKVSAWREGGFVVLPDAELEDCTVWVGAAANRSDAVKWEGLLARRLSDSRARVCAVPFWAYDLNLGDEVGLMHSAEVAPVVTGVVVDGGNHAFRVRFEDAADNDGRWRQLMVDLERFDCWFDVRSPAFLAVSAPPAHAQVVADYLDAREQHADLLFETGRSAPPTNS